MEIKKRRHRFRLFILLLLVLAGAGTLLSRLHDVQIEQQEISRARIPGNRTVTVREPGVRGLITDRSGQIVLATNLRKYEVTLNLKEIKKAWILQKKENLVFDSMTSGAQGMPKKTTETDIIGIVEELIRPKLKSYGIEKGYSKSALRTHFITHGGLIPFTYPAELTYDQFASLAENNLQLPGVYVSIRPHRHYPYGTLACHVLGYLKLWEKGSIPLNEKKFNYNHYLGDDRGIMGVEATMNDQLLGLPGVKTILKNEKGHVLGIQDYTPPSQGSTIALTIDARLQYTVENILRQAGRAAAIVLDPNTGHVLAMASTPNYNPNEFIPSISQKEFDVYNTNKARPFTNRCISQYMPGSTMKLPVAIAGALHGQSGLRCNCTGSIHYRGAPKPIGCHRSSGHGTIALARAVQVSCNPYFMTMGNRVGSKELASTLELLGFGTRAGIRLPSVRSGVVPGGSIWKDKYPTKRMSAATVALSSIGQGEMEATPLQIATATATIANGGRYYQPSIIHSIDHPIDGLQIQEPKLLIDLLKEGVNSSGLQKIRHGMYLAANESGGTASRAALKNVTIAAKTGTVQLGVYPRFKNNAWTTSFAPYKKPRYVVTVLVEGGKSGGKVAGPIVHQIYRALFASESGNLRLPIAKMDYFGGHFDPIEEIKLPKGELLAIALEAVEETPAQASGVAEANSSTNSTSSDPDAPQKVTPGRIPLPSITPQDDSE